MRVIKFRGKRIDNGAWETGCAVVLRQGLSNEKWFIADKMTGYHTPVDANTVGQFTGLHDIEGKDIYEGDILCEVGAGKLVEVVYDAPEFCFKDNTHGYRFLNHPECFEVAGNIHDNPDLLEGGEV